MLDWIARIWSKIVGDFRLWRKVSALEKIAKRLKSEREAFDQKIIRQREEIDNLQIKTSDRINKLYSTVDQSRQTQKKLEIALEAAQEELRAKDEIVIPGLVAADRALISRWETEAAIQSMNQARMSTAHEEEA